MPEIRRAIGLMSGTSLDGVDVALLDTDGERIAAFGPARTFSYNEPERRLFCRAFEEARTLTDRDARPGVLKEAEALVTAKHAEAVEEFLSAEFAGEGKVDLVGFHGQTVFHDPGRSLTIQIGDGEALAERLGVPVVWDFRAADMAAGGQGAPLAPVFHRALAETAGTTPPVLFLNIGGVANITYAGRDDLLIAFDTGPGNGLLDDWVRRRTGEPFDTDGRLSASGSPAEQILDALLASAYFRKAPPKSLDRDAFSVEALAGLSDSDGAATLLQFTARSIATSVRLLPEPPRACFVSGGGRHNSEMMRAVAAALVGIPVEPIETLGFDGDATEAQAFAFLAVRSNDGKALSYPLTTGVPQPLTGGRMSRPTTRG